MANQAWTEERHEEPQRPEAVSIFGRLAELIGTYRRYLRAGQEIEKLLNLSDAQLAARNLRREDVGRKTFAKHSTPAVQLCC